MKDAVTMQITFRVFKKFNRLLAIWHVLTPFFIFIFQATRARGFSEPLPPSAPSYQDLMSPYEDVDPEAEFFAK